MKDLFLDSLNVGLTCALFILLFWLCSPLIERRYAAKWKRLVWVIVSLRLLVPIRLSAFRPKIVIPIAPVELSGEGTALILGQTAAAAQRHVTVLDVAAMLWVAGILLSVAVYIVSYAFFRHSIAVEANALRDQTTHFALKVEAKALGLRHTPHILTWNNCASPMVIGVIRPLLVLPDEKYSLEELRLIFRHELNHIKRGDMLLKILMSAAKCIHWYNPLIRIMPALADLDMELSCDDEVTQDYPDAVRKAYAEVLFSFVRRQYKLRAGIPVQAFSTQFYGGKKIMKKRFNNIYSGSKKKRGLMLLATAATLILVMSSIAACGETASKAETPPPTFGPAVEADVVIVDMAAVNPDSTVRPIQPAPQPTNEDQEALSQLVNEFSTAYFAGDEKTLRTFLTNPYTWDVDVYSAGSVSNVKAKGLDSVSDLAVGDVKVVSVEFTAAGEDSFTYLTIEAIKQADGWYVQFFGLEK